MKRRPFLAGLAGLCLAGCVDDEPPATNWQDIARRDRRRLRELELELERQAARRRRRFRELELERQAARRRR